MTRRRSAILWLAMLVVLACGCSTLPVSGRVHSDVAGSGEGANEVPYFSPPGPSTGDTPEAIVRGFLLAMQANPPSTAVARGFLSSRAKSTWQPSQGTIVYDAPTVTTGDGSVVARLRGAHRLSPEGVWLDGTSSSTITLPLTMVQEAGQWRIDNPPNALAVPEGYFSSLFVPFNLYWFDRTGRALVPTKVYVPRGEETATNLVRGLLAGPPQSERDVAVTAVPPKTELDFAVVVNDAGVAEVPLGATVLRLAPADLHRLLIQLTWTLRQVPGIDRLRITVDGAPVPLTDGRTDVSITQAAEYDPLASTQHDLLVISGGRVVRDDGDRGVPIPGPFGATGFSLRSLAWNARQHEIAAVSGNGRRAFVGPDRGPRSAVQVRPVLDAATDLLRPAYDRLGGLWLVDRTAAGAVVHLVRNGHDRVLAVRGITGRRISAFTVTHDGTALVAVLATGTNPTVEVSNIERSATGRVDRLAPARTLQVGGDDLGAGRDVAQNGATSVAVLTEPVLGSDRIVYVELDGSPGPQVTPDQGAPQSTPGDIDALVSSPDPVLPLRVVGADRRLFTYSDTGSWSPASLDNVVAAAYAE